MTLSQLAVAARSDVKWVLNSSALLRRRIRATVPDARWWALLRLLTEDLALPLQAAAEAADSVIDALRADTRAREVDVLADPSGSAALRIDVHRFQSMFLGNLSRSLVLETPRRRGRPPRPSGSAVESASRYGIDLGLVRAALERTPAERLEMLEGNAAFVRAMRQRST